MKFSGCFLLFLVAMAGIPRTHQYTPLTSPPRSDRLGDSRLAGNENAHDAARAVVYLARQSADRDSAQAERAEEERMVASSGDHARDRKITFKEILMYYRKVRHK
ncbi:hypothetical protein HPB50_004232 [Hyalomma asiaticum]|uniref:Uncharacterized protein n=1 Tax=Hyalomma asiaticum TaxID=266040 RepID=A0ACB7T5N4_HYAAI|nr:hypothetical protein HPB50_004232 [Hyalomma asiaticum]